MKKAHPKNERIKRKYLQWLETAKGMTPATADQVAAAISAFEKSTNWKNSYTTSLPPRRMKPRSRSVIAP